MLSGNFNRGGVYRTPFLHDLFRHNELVLKEKRLLFVEQPVRKIGENLQSARDEIRISRTAVLALLLIDIYVFRYNE